MPDLAKAARPDAVIATGRSDFPNQVNNVLCFPFIFRGALDVGATTVNEAMKLASVRALADLAMAEQSDIVAMAYGEQNLRFGPEYLIPRPFDPRLIVMIAPAVAKAAMDSGVATRPIADFAAYREKLTQFVYHSGLLMKPIFAAAKKDPKRIVYAEGEDERVLRAVQIVLDEGLAQPIVIGRPAVLERAGREARPAHPAGHGLPGGQSRVRPALSRLLDRVLRAHGAQGRVAAVREDRDAPAADADRRDADPHGRSGRHALRHVRHARAAPRVHRAGHRAAPRDEGLRRDECRHAAEPHGVHRGHLRQRRSRRPSRSPRSRCSPRRRSAASASRPRSRCCRTRASGAASTRRRRRCRRRWRW